LSLVRVSEALRRRYRKALIAEEETRTLVLNHGGDPENWGRLACIMGFGGHPRLTHAFAMGIAARGWPIEESEATFETVLSAWMSEKAAV